jgi:hypothetical protein
MASLPLFDWDVKSKDLEGLRSPRLQYTLSVE